MIRRYLVIRAFRAEVMRCLSVEDGGDESVEAVVFRAFSYEAAWWGCGALRGCEADTCRLLLDGTGRSHDLLGPVVDATAWGRHDLDIGVGSAVHDVWDRGPMRTFEDGYS
jgi:hypothetical protein